MRHLIGGAVAGGDPPRRRVRVALVPRGVVVGPAHRNHRAPGQRQRRRQLVHGLPVQIPVGDVHEPLGGAVWPASHGAHLACDVVRVRVDRQHLHGDRKLELVGHGKAGRAGGNVERAIVLELQQHREPGRRAIGEVEPERRAHRLRLSGRPKVQVEDQVRARLDRPRDGVRRRSRLASRASRTGNGCPARNDRTRSPGPCRQSPLPHPRHRAGGPRRCDPAARWRDGGCGRCPDESPSRARIAVGERHGQHEVPEHIAALGRQRPCAVGRQHQIGCAELPSAFEGRRRRAIGGAPSSTPCSTHRASVAICAGSSRRSPLKVPWPSTGGHGGITRAPVTFTICRARRRTSA